MDNVFQRFDINTGDISVATVEKMNRVYHEILDGLSKSKEDNGDLNSRRNKIKNEWLTTTDLPAEAHTMLDDVEDLLLGMALDDPDNPDAVKLLAPAYERALALATEIKRHLTDQINRVANPGGKRQIVGTKAEAKDLRKIAQSLANVYGTLAMMDESLPAMPNLEWRDIPPGRDVELTTTPYIGGVMRYSLTDVDWMTKTEFIQTISCPDKRWTRYEFDTAIEEAGYSLRKDETIQLDNLTFHQRRFPN